MPLSLDTAPLLERLRGFCLPGGEEAVNSVRAIRLKERGEMRTAPGAKWTSFEAEEFIDAERSVFCWEARFKGMSVTDAYENGHGRLVLKLGGVIPVKKMTGRDVDRGELQRYLGSVGICPPMLVRHGSLVWDAVGPSTLRMSDREDPMETSVDLHLGVDGSPVASRAERPRVLGKQVVLTPWSGVATDFHEREGMRLATRMEALWHPPEGEFVYYRAEVTSSEIVR